MTDFLHWRRMRWGLVLWAGYVALWMVIVGSGVAIAVFWWLTGVVVFGSLWLATQPRFRRGCSMGGAVVRAGWTSWRLRDVHRGRRPDARNSRSGASQPPEYR